MSFRFNWGDFPPEFNAEALEMLTRALNEGGNKPPNLVGPIVAKELDLGSQAPQLDILEISELDETRFRAMFRMRYEGDGFLVLQTQVQANPLRLETSDLPTMPTVGVVAAAEPLVVPMLLRISGLRLNGIVVLAVSKDDGITLVFRSDPLVSVEVHSTFDSVPSVRRMLQREIEATLRSLFRDDLPVIVHAMSVSEIRRAREAKERARREHIERQQQRIRLQHARTSSVSDAWTARGAGSGSGSGSGPGSGAASATLQPPPPIAQHLMASQLHQRLVELSQENRRARAADSAVDGEEPGHGLRTPPPNPSNTFATPRAPRAGLHGHWSPDLSDGASAHSADLEALLGDDWARAAAAAEMGLYHHHYRRLGRAQPDQSEAGLGDLQNGVVLRPSDNAVAARLASLMSMGHTLSPYTRRFTHTTMRADVNPRLGHYAPRHSSSAYARPGPDHPPLDGAAAGSPPSSSPPQQLLAGAFSQPVSSSSDMPAFRDPRHHHHHHHPVSAGAMSASPFPLATSVTPPGAASAGAGVRSPFSRNRALRRKVHRVGQISLSAGSAEE
ncbi:ERMES complex subunit [Coemansia javaensis]|uniref:ERMES complex subunit n=1 Tax=Coemansia javaensis TaxID=2761396 RepID=A0A9W8LMC3_9FUNG|nr:ERMES complex subunit [Coemansia javaensis]